MRPFVILLLVFGVFLPQSATAESWCSQAKRADELTICKSRKLLNLEAELLSQYRKALNDANEEDAKLVKKAQRAWLLKRSECSSNVDCISAQYKQRIVALSIGDEISELENPDSGQPKNDRSLLKGESSFGVVKVIYPNSKTQSGVDALIVANDVYSALDDLNTPKADAALVSSALAFRGIRARTITNVDSQTLTETIASFKRNRSKEIFIFYYAGHAADINGVSSLIFSDFEISSADEEQRSFARLPNLVGEISKLGYKKILIVFDACRDLVTLPNQQITDIKKANVTQKVRSIDSREVGVGALQGIDYAISFSASKGQSAIDSIDGKNSPFAKAFAFKLREKASLFEVMIETRREVRTATNQLQHPTLELSWDEDAALNANPIGLIEFTFSDDVPARPTKNLSDISSRTEYGSSLLDVTHEVKAERSCGLYSNNATGIGFSLYEMLACIQKHYNFQVDGNIGYLSLGSGQVDGAVYNYESLSLTVDLDGNGVAEKLEFGHDRNGGRLTFSAAGHQATFYSALGPNASTVFLDDVDGNGIRDIIIEYERQSQGQVDGSQYSIAVLSGERLMKNMDGVFRQGDDELKFAPYISESKWMGRLGGLYPISIFHDENLKHISGIVGQSVKYTTYSPTWEKTDQNIMPNKEVTFRRDGSILMDSDGDKYELSSFGSPDFKVTRQ